MSSAISETPGTWPTSVTAPDGTDVVSITALRSAMEDINDRVLRTRQSLGMAIVAGSGTSTTRCIPPKGEHYEQVWEGSGSGYFTQIALSSGYELSFVIDASLVPHGATITELTARVNPPGGHGGVNPTVMPAIRLVRVPVASSMTPAVVDTEVDATAAGSYEAEHAITMSGMSEVVDYSTYSYLLQIRGENTGTAAVNLVAQAGTVTYTPPV